MAIPGKVEGKKMRIYVTDDGVTGDKVIVASMNSYEKTSNANVDSTPTFDDAVDPATPGSREQTFSIGGLYVANDAGQNMIRDAEIAGTPVFLHIYPDGLAGFKQQVKIASTGHRATPAGFQEYTFDCAALAAAVKDPDGTTGYIP